MNVKIKNNALKPSQDHHYRLLVDAVTHYAIYMVDPDGYITSWNAGARRFIRYEAAGIIGRHFSCLYTAEDNEAGLPQKALDTALRDGMFESEGWRVREDGTRFWAHATIDPVIEPSTGELAGYAETIRDLTEQKSAEKELRKSEEQFKLLVQGVTDYAIYMLDNDGRVSSWNAGAQHIKRYRPDEIIGRHFSTFYTPEDIEAGLPQRALKTAREEGKFEHEGWRVRKGGSRFWASVLIDPIRNDDGEIIGFVKITRDITERKEVQKQLEKTREALFQSQKMEAIGQLTGGIAHDFNNLLMAVLGSLELLGRRMPDEPRLKVLVDNAAKGAQRGVALTKRMLAFARRQELHLTVVHVPSLINGIHELVQRSLGASVTVETDLPENLQKVKADPNQVELAILNLAMNARDAMPNGGVIRIVARDMPMEAQYGAGPDRGSFVCLSVIDNGEGMDEATLAKATEPFFTTKGLGKGTGLGLSMVHGFAEQSGGRLVLTSRQGEGTTADLWIPAADSEDIEKSIASPAGEHAKAEPITVLAVDDDPLVLLNTVAMLEDLGHTVVEANSAKQALGLIHSRKDIELVITDHLMPQITGVEFADILRTMDPDIKIILATGFAELDAGLAPDLPRLTKPFTQSDLAAIVERSWTHANKSMR